MAKTMEAVGFVPIPNDNFDAMIRTPMPDSTRRALLMAVRMTWGYRRDEYLFSVGEMSERMGMHRAVLNRALRDLRARGVIALERTGHKVLLTIKDSEFSRRWNQSNSVPIKGLPRRNQSNSVPDQSNSVPDQNDSVPIPSIKGVDRQIMTDKKDIPGGPQDILDIFNRITQKHIGMNPRISAEIRARKREGMVVADFERAAKAAMAVWSRDPEMRRNILPSTVFGKRMSEFSQMATDKDLGELDYWRVVDEED